MSDIKIFVIGHKEYPVPPCNLLYPIQAGAELAEKPIENWLHDDGGENISAKNRSFCELTVHYYAWKNIQADYYGFFHYRRYLSLREDIGSRPYKIEKTPNKDMLEKYNMSVTTPLLSGKYDAVIPKCEEMWETVYEHYGRSPFQHKKDLDLAISILTKKYPQYKPAADRYLNSTKSFFCNMFIFRREIFFRYCEWIFDILSEVENNLDTTGYSKEEKRVYGFIAERLTGIFFTKLTDENISIKQVQRVDFAGGKGYIKKKLTYCFLPPESRRRKLFKKILNK